MQRGHTTLKGRWLEHVVGRHRFGFRFYSILLDNSVDLDAIRRTTWITTIIKQ
jgi:hypothetical protein